MLAGINRFLEKRMAFVTPTCLLIGVLFPDFAARGLGMVPFVFALMTFIGGLKSSFRDVAGVFRRPLPLLLCLAILHVVLPAAAWGIGHMLFPDRISLITGMVLEFAVPAAVTGVMWVTIYQGNHSLSLSLVILDTLLAPFVIPATLHVLIGARVEMDTAGMMRKLALMIALPAVAALCLNQTDGGERGRAWSGKLAPISKLCLIFVVTTNSSKVAPYVRHMTGELAEVAAAILCLAAVGYLLGWLAARLLKTDRETETSMLYGAGMRNISAGAVLAAAYFPGEVMFPVMIGTLFQQVLASTFGTLICKRETRETQRKGGNA